MGAPGLSRNFDGVDRLTCDLRGLPRKTLANCEIWPIDFSEVVSDILACAKQRTADIEYSTEANPLRTLFPPCSSCRILFSRRRIGAKLMKSCAKKPNHFNRM